MELIGQFCAYLERMGYMERDSLRDLLYCLARLGLFWFINFFGVIMGKTVILGVIGSFVTSCIPLITMDENFTFFIRLCCNFLLILSFCG